MRKASRIWLLMTLGFANLENNFALVFNELKKTAFHFSVVLYSFWSE